MCYLMCYVIVHNTQSWIRLSWRLKIVGITFIYHTYEIYLSEHFFG